FESVNDNHVVLGSLASRSQRKPMTISGIGPYTISGTDSTTGDPYSFQTDWNYAPSTAAYARESDERTLTSPFNATSDTNATRLGRSGVLMLKSSTNCLNTNNSGGIQSYCSVYGPDVYSAPFSATAGQAVSFDWSALRVTDDYEIYAFLVAVTETSPGVFDYGSPATHTLLVHGRGHDQAWTSASGLIPAAGSYRFRFVNGSYDGTGGLALGSEMYIDSVVRVGLANPIAFPAIGDKVLGASAFTVSATAPGGPVTFTSATTGKCTLPGTTVTTVSGQTGICTIVANQTGDGVDYVPADSVARSFTILAAATAPTNSGAPTLSGSLTPGSTFTVNEGTWADGGSPITSTTVQWRTTTGGVTIDVVGGTGSTCLVVAQAGSTISVRVTKTNAVGSTSVSSAQSISGYACVAAVAPAWTDSTLVPIRVGEAVVDGVAASGQPAPTYSVTAGSLPAGLSLDPTTGAITGTPTTVGPYSFTITAGNGVGSAVVAHFSGSVAPATSAAIALDVAVDRGSGVGGAPVEVRGSGLKPRSTVVIALSTQPGDLATVQTDDDGAFVTTVVLPVGLTPGAHDIVATGVAPDEQPVTAIERLVVDWSGSKVDPPSSDGYVPVSPVRVLDTRTTTKLDAGSVLELPVTAEWGVDAGATSVVVNVTATEPETDGFVTVYPCGTAMPLASAVNFEAGETVPNLVVVPIGADRRVCLYSMSRTHLVVDLNGFHSPEGTDKLVPSVPSRLLDTRTGTKLATGQVVEIPVTGAEWAPDGSGAVVLNVTATEPESDGFVTLFPCGGGVPTASNLNFVAGQTVANHAFVKVGERGSVCAYTMSPTHLVVDLNGAYDEGGADDFVGFVPGRALDTRGGPRLPAGQIVELGLATGGLDHAAAFALNVTATEAAGSGFITVYPCGGDIPVASNVNYVAGESIANHVTAKVGAGGRVCLYTSQSIHLVVDVEGAYM
ncbi:MAG: putative Ig domain-containing protein, partial [Actinobacteria bacterium]|nr:putative Ig domain-containing protein [Actinomycetota bacterium]